MLMHTAILSGTDLPTPLLTEVTRSRVAALYLLHGSVNLHILDSRYSAIMDDTSLHSKLGALHHGLRQIMAEYEIDVVLLDLPPSVGGLTRLAMLSSDYFMMPVTADFFSVQAANSFADVIVGPSFHLQTLLQQMLQDLWMGQLLLSVMLDPNPSTIKGASTS
eukprot:m.26140 g.26140  ORF g.26140 m.26140 type:complete len:163 (-) comp11661_c0_seq1:634-1122(-)